jgi:hypothetical protein
MSSQESGSSGLLSGLLVSVLLPNLPDAKTEAVTISDDQWEDVLWDRETEEQNQSTAVKPKSRSGDELFVLPEDDVPRHSKGDWVGVDRDRRSAFLIIGALRSDGLI